MAPGGTHVFAHRALGPPWGPFSLCSSSILSGALTRRCRLAYDAVPTMASTSRRIASAPRLRHVFVAASLLVAQTLGAAPVSAQPKGAPAGASADAAAKKALDLFKKGQALYKANKFAEALPLFRESFALVPSPNSRILIARCLVGTGDFLAGYQEFDAVIADVDARQEAKYQQTRDAAVQERDELANTKLAIVTISVANAAPGTRVAIGDKDIPADTWGKPMPMMPGAVDVTLTTPPAPPQTQRVDLRAGEKRPIALDAAPGGAPPPPPPTTSSGGSRAVLRPIAYLAGGIGVAGFGVFGVFGGLASATYSDLESKCSGGEGSRVCPSDTQGQIDDGKMQKDVANIGLIVGAVGLAAGVTLFVLSIDRGPKKEAAVHVQPVVAPGYVGFQGAF